MENLAHIFIFKTDISTEACKAKLRAVLDSHEAIEKWNVALDDQDYVLRVISPSLSAQEIINLINFHGHYCAELA